MIRCTCHCEAGTGYTYGRLPPASCDVQPEEASALLLGSKLAERFADEAAQKHFSAALYKIKAVLRGTDKDYVEDLTDRYCRPDAHDASQ